MRKGWALRRHRRARGKSLHVERVIGVLLFPAHRRWPEARADRKFKRPFHTAPRPRPPQHPPAAPPASAACNLAAHGGARSGRGDEERRDKTVIAFVQGTPAAGGKFTWSLWCTPFIVYAYCLRMHGFPLTDRRGWHGTG